MKAILKKDLWSITSFLENKKCNTDSVNEEGRFTFKLPVAKKRRRINFKKNPNTSFFLH